MNLCFWDSPLWPKKNMSVQMQKPNKVRRTTRVFSTADMTSHSLPGNSLRPFWFMHLEGVFQIVLIHPRSLTARPWKMVVGRWSFPIGKVTFQGRTVKLREGIFSTFCALPLRVGSFFLCMENPVLQVTKGNFCHTYHWCIEKKQVCMHDIF